MFKMPIEPTHGEPTGADDMPFSPPLWYVVRRRPNAQSNTIARFNSRAAAEAQLQCLAKLSSSKTYDVVFDCGLD